jgi:hypothetical protein
MGMGTWVWVHGYGYMGMGTWVWVHGYGYMGMGMGTWVFAFIGLPSIEIGLEHAPFVVLVNFFPHLNMQKPADYGPKQH